MNAVVTDADVDALTNFQQGVDALTIEDHEDCAAADALRVRMNKLRIDIDKRRKKAKQPFLESSRLVDQQAKLILDPLKTSLSELDNKLAAYARQIEARRRQEEEQMRMLKEAEDAKAGETGIPAPTMPQAFTMPAPVHTHNTKELDIYDEGAVPQKFWILDKVAIRAAINNGEEVPGARLVPVRRIG